MAHTGQRSWLSVRRVVGLTSRDVVGQFHKVLDTKLFGSVVQYLRFSLVVLLREQRLQRISQLLAALVESRLHHREEELLVAVERFARIAFEPYDCRLDLRRRREHVL